MRFGSKGAEPGVIAATADAAAAHAVVASEQRLEVEREPVGGERGHGVVVVWVEGLLLGLRLGGGLRKGGNEVVIVGVVVGVRIGVEGGVVVADGGHDGYVAVVRGVVDAGYTC